MSFEEIALAAECITLARIEFVEKVLMEPLVAMLGGKVTKGAKPQKTHTKKKAQANEKDTRAKVAALKRLLGG